MLKRISVHLSFLAIMSMVLTTFIVPLNTVRAEDMFAMVGFATLNGGTTGGANGTEVTATSVSEVNTLLSTRRKNNDTSPLVIKFNGKITGTEVIAAKDVSNITFLGVGTRGELEGVGINLVRANNIIIRNLKIHHTIAPMDCIGIEDSKNVWVDHCELFNMLGDCNGDGKIDTKGDISGGDVDWYDGLLDVKKDSAYITVSWNYFHDAFKTSLVGSSDSDTSDRKMTFHHNIYSNTKSRLPSYRGGTGHMFNNYYVNADGSGINSRMGAKLRIENNVFENVGTGSMDSSGFAEGPIGSYYSSSIGYWDVSNNRFINCKGNQPTTSTCSFSPPYNYSSVLTPVDNVKSIVSQYAGVGKIDGSSAPIVLPTSGSNPTQITTPAPTPTKTQKNTDIIYGDLNGDGNANSLDFAMLRMVLLGSLQLSDSQRYGADLNVDGNINSLDFAFLRQFLLGMIDKLPYGSGTVVNPTTVPQNTWQPVVTPSNSSGITHEAEASANNFKYASILSNYVVFDAVKDAYIEMKQVGSHINGTATITFVYSNGSGMNLPMEIKVNGSTIESEKVFPSTGSWGTWSTLSINANMTSDTSNVIRFKTISNVGGPRLDKIIVSGGSTNYTPPPTIPTSNPTSSIPTTPVMTSQPINGDIILEPNSLTTLQQAINSIQPGRTIYLKSGTYKYSTTILIPEGNNGNSGSMKTIAAYGSDKPVLDFSAMEWGSSNRGIVLAGNHWAIKGVKIQYAGDNGILLSGHYNLISNCEFYANGDTGLQLSRYNSSYSTIDKWPSNNTIEDCYSHSNYDKDNGEDADGFAAKLTCGYNNKFIRCVAKYNVDDGWDLYTKDDTGPIGSVYLEGCEASYNGKTESGQYTADSDGNGFKLGGSKISVDHKLVNCKAYNNKKHGFTWNSNPGNLVLTGCQASGNGGNDFEKVYNR